MSRSEWTLLILLVASIFINYIDRSNLSIAAPLLQKELSLSPVQVGLLLSSFFWTYALLQLVGIAGWLADRFPVTLVFAAGFLLWSLATIATGLLSGFFAIYIARLVLGAGESLAYPCYSRIFASQLPQHHRGRANALLDAASKLGPAFGTFLGGRLLGQLGWRWFFIALGVGSLLWLLPWFWYSSRSSSASSETASVATQPFTEIFRLRSAWGTFLGHFCGNYFWFFLFTWIPFYLVKERSFTLEGMANVVSGALAAVALATIAAGWISDRLIARGASPTVVRKSIVVGGLALSSVILPVAFVASAEVSVTLLLLACMAFGTYTSNHWAITQTLAGPRMAGRWTSLQNGVGNVSGIIAPWLAGTIVALSGSSKLAFAISALIVLAGAAIWGLAVGPVEEVRWRNH
ncbi:MAG: MFS transporter [Acidobacteriaceae bacterium]|nr:MFS transporter [Acidobacteriaceae bacterium]